MIKMKYQAIICLVKEKHKKMASLANFGWGFIGEVVKLEWPKWSGKKSKLYLYVCKNNFVPAIPLYISRFGWIRAICSYS